MAGAPSQWILSSPKDGTVDEVFSVGIELVDKFGNRCVQSGNQSIIVSATLLGQSKEISVDIQTGLGVAEFTFTIPGVYLYEVAGNSPLAHAAVTNDVSSGATTRYVIQDPLDGTVDRPVEVTIVAQDQFHNINTKESRAITLETTGNATGGGIVNIVNGEGSAFVSSHVPETITLSLVDSANTGVNVLSKEVVMFGPGESQCSLV